MSGKYRYFLTIEYIGTEYSGSQIQPNGKTIQGEIENAIETITKQKIKIRLSGRTDRGVHARGQKSHFDIDQKININRFIYSLNSILPNDISIKEIKEVEKPLHAQKSAKYKFYRYVIFNAKQRSAFMGQALHISDKLDVEAMNEAIKSLEGVHDFSAFKRSRSTNPAVECTIFKAECSACQDYIYIDLIGNRFLYNMVRIIVGTLIEIGRHQKDQKYLMEVLQSKDRNLAGKTVVPDGLTLMYVGYDNKYNEYIGG